ncbi:thiol methyltransferase [Pseudovirgaria hyperparasitica]|uniref:Thiol methyltransferase n=1 Tax=Pseudovirgaria hyperparasitica TaxID=470096 RepID=A0A6A6WHX6_9PEZI|nr:thiol methyltransferase [Pseudovirgaria hyperparasitica]KAF2762413.1 thiol methyltransferase [Pseudovirgaria hyperparasitica]
MSGVTPNLAADTPERARLRSHFHSDDRTKDSSKWDELYKEGFLPWDKGFPSPALVDALAQKKDILGSPITRDGKRKTALVPGCGKGYDVALLASYGYDAWGLEVSPLAVKACADFKQGIEESGEYKAVDGEIGRGSIHFMEGDFYKSDWVEKIGGTVDLIYDYTFLCAMHPDHRPAWSFRMSQLLSPKGHLLCLEFPSYKEPSTGGPPFAVREEVYIEHLKRPGVRIPYNEDGFIIQEPSAKPNEHALKKLLRWKPDRTHKIGEGTDWMSIWSHHS